MGDQLQLSTHLQIRHDRAVNCSGRQLPLDGHHRDECSAEACLDSVFDRLQRIQFHLDAQPLNVQAGSSQQLIHHLAGGGLGIKADKAQSVEVFFGEFRQASQGMLHRQHQSQLVAGVGHHLEQVVELRRQFTTDDRQIDLAIGHAPARAARAVNLQLDRHIRILLPEQTNHPGHQISASGLARSDDQGAALEVVQIIQSTAGLMALAEDPIAITEQQVPGFRQLRFAPPTVKQRHLQLLLKVLDLQADGRLRDVEAVGRFFEASFADDGAKDAELIQREGQIGHRARCGRAWNLGLPRSTSRITAQCPEADGRFPPQQHRDADPAGAVCCDPQRRCGPAATG